MRICFIINKTAGRGRVEKLWPLVKQKIESYQWEVTALFTEAKGDAYRLAQDQIGQNYDMVVAIGGDGTLSEVINGLIGTETKIGLIPLGTGNDFARKLGIPLEWEKACEILINGITKKIDVGIINGQYFVNVSGVGFDAEVAEEINKNIKKLIGLRAYFIAILKCLWNFKTYKTVIDIDGQKIIKDIILMAVGNASYYGGGLNITPMAKVDDGILDICIIEKTSRIDLLLNLPLVMKGKHLKHPKVKMFKGKNIKISSEQPIPVQADGEVIGTTPVKYSIAPGKVLFVVNKE